jgi:hypothetical protein
VLFHEWKELLNKEIDKYWKNEWEVEKQRKSSLKYLTIQENPTRNTHTIQGFQSGPVPGTFTRLRSCIIPAEITEPPKVSGGQNHKYDGR